MRRLGCHILSLSRTDLGGCVYRCVECACESGAKGCALGEATFYVRCAREYFLVSPFIHVDITVRAIGLDGDFELYSVNDIESPSNLTAGMIFRNLDALPVEAGDKRVLKRRLASTPKNRVIASKASLLKNLANPKALEALCAGFFDGAHPIHVARGAALFGRHKRAAQRKALGEVAERHMGPLGFLRLCIETSPRVLDPIAVAPLGRSDEAIASGARIFEQLTRWAVLAQVADVLRRGCSAEVLEALVSNGLANREEGVIWRARDDSLAHCLLRLQRVPANNATNDSDDATPPTCHMERHPESKRPATWRYPPFRDTLFSIQRIELHVGGPEGIEQVFWWGTPCERLDDPCGLRPGDVFSALFADKPTQVGLDCDVRLVDYGVTPRALAQCALIGEAFGKGISVRQPLAPDGIERASDDHPRVVHCTGSAAPRIAYSPDNSFGEAVARPSDWTIGPDGQISRATDQGDGSPRMVLNGLPLRDSPKTLARLELSHSRLLWVDEAEPSPRDAAEAWRLTGAKLLAGAWGSRAAAIR